MLNKIFNLLKNQSIIQILDGDSNFGYCNISGAESSVTISMPYLTKSDIYNIASQFGLVFENEKNVIKSRKVYFEELLSYCNQKDKISKENIEYIYEQITNRIIEEINKILYFSDNEFVRIGDIFSIHPIASNITVSTPSIKVIDRAYVKDISNRAIQDIEAGNYDSALTKSRTLLEEVFCYVIESKGENFFENGNIKKLYNQVKKLYNMHQNQDLDKRINMLLSGLEKILTAITEMRNNESDAHGVGNRRINIKEHHARLFVNSATTMADFILSVEKANH